MFIEQRAIVGGQELNYARGPERRETLLFLHGVSRRWETFLNLLPQLSSRYEIIALDHRGHGKSSMAKSYYVADYVQDVVGFVREVIGRPTLIYGHSLGAMAAVGAAAEIPDLVRGIILEDPPFGAMGKKIGEGALKSIFAGMQMCAGDSRPVADIARDFGEVEVHDAQTGSSIQMREIRDGVSLRFAARSLQDVDPQVFSSIVVGDWLRGYEMEKIFPRVMAPTLLMQADPGAGGMLADEEAEDFRRQAREVVLIQMAGVPHLMHWGAAERVLTNVWGFLNSIAD